MSRQIIKIPAFSYDKKHIEEHLKEYVNNISLPDSFKANIADKKFLQDNPGFYVDYPLLFLKNSKKLGENVKDLCVAAILYYESIIILDSVLDKNRSASLQFPIIMCCQEEAIKILSRYFPIESLFWEKWNVRKLEYLRAFKNDRSHNVNSIEEFEAHADDKSAIGKVAIDALYYMRLIPSIETYEKYLLMHRYYYTAFQIFDDITDVREDLKSGQFNIALWKIKQNIKHGICSADVLDNVNLLIKELYEGDIVESLTKLAATYIDKTLQMAKDEGLEYFYAESCRMRNMMVDYQKGIEAYFYELKISQKLSVNKIRETRLSVSIENAIDFLKQQQETDGAWMDLCVRNNICDNFSTSFVLFMLKESHVIAWPMLKLAEEYLKMVKMDTLWGKSQQSLADNNTSILSVLALDDTKEIPTLCKKLNEDGGISALCDKVSLFSSMPVVHEWETNTDGWLQSHVCVSSSLLYLFAKSGYRGSEYDKLIEFVKNKIKAETDIVYWWIDDIYTLYFLAKANEYIQDDELYNFVCRKTEEKLGSVRNMDSYEYNFFFLGLLMYLLCYVGKLAEARDICNIIIQNQYDDGSWPESDFMCIPRTEEMTSQNSKCWKVSDIGMNVRIREFHRLITTSTLIMSLSEFQKHGKL